MKIKLFITIVSIISLMFIINLEQNDEPFNNLSAITNNGDYNSISGSSKSISYLTSEKSVIKLPDFKFKLVNSNTDGSIYNINSDKIILHFWASWCGICQKEFDSIIKYSKTHPETTIVNISIDDDKDKLDNYLTQLDTKYKLNFYNKMGIDNTNIANTKANRNNLLFVWDKDKSISLNLFNVSMVPESYIMNNKYEVIEQYTGKTNWQRI